MNEVLNKPATDIKLKVVDHPGFRFEGELLNTFPGKKAILGINGGGYYGHVSRFLSANFSRVACLTVFNSVQAKALVKAHNGGKS